MPTVPGQPGQVIPFPAQQKIDPTYLLMAAATMHEQGRLFEPTKKFPIRTGPADDDVVNFEMSDMQAGRSEQQRRLMDPKRPPNLKEPELTPEEAEDVPGRRII